MDNNNKDSKQFFSLSSERINENIKHRKTIANDPVIQDVKDIIGETVNRFGQKVFEGKISLEPKDFEKFAKLYLTIINQENEEIEDDGESARNLKEDAKQLEALKNLDGFEEITNRMADMLENKNQKQLSSTK